MDAIVARYTWRPITATSTFVAFTVVTVINTYYNTTHTSTKWADTPKGFQPPKTNSDGRKVDTVTYYVDGTPKVTEV